MSMTRVADPVIFFCIRIHGSGLKIRIRIRVTQKRPYLDPQHCAPMTPLPQVLQAFNKKLMFFNRRFPGVLGCGKITPDVLDRIPFAKCLYFTPSLSVDWTKEKFVICNVETLGTNIERKWPIRWSIMMVKG